MGGGGVRSANQNGEKLKKGGGKPLPTFFDTGRDQPPSLQ